MVQQYTSTTPLVGCTALPFAPNMAPPHCRRERRVLERERALRHQIEALEFQTKHGMTRAITHSPIIGGGSSPHRRSSSHGAGGNSRHLLSTSEFAVDGKHMNPIRWTEADTAAWVSTLPGELHRYETLFRTNNINGSRLLKLTDEGLETGLGISSYVFSLDPSIT